MSIERCFGQHFERLPSYLPCWPAEDMPCSSYQQKVTVNEEVAYGTSTSAQNGQTFARIRLSMSVRRADFDSAAIAECLEMRQAGIVDSSRSESTAGSGAM